MIINLKANIDTHDVWFNGKKLNPTKSFKLRNHSPDGFNWGDGGSGSSQLALAILLEIVPEDVALKNYINFKFKYITQLPFKSFEKDIDIDEKIFNK